MKWKYVGVEGTLQHPSIQFSSVQFSHSVKSNSLQPHGLQHARLSCPSLSPRVCSNPCPLSQCDEYYWSIKQNTDTCTTWMNLTLRPYIDYISVGRCQTQKRTYCIIPFIKKLKNKQSHFMVIDTRTKGAFGGGLGRAWHIMEWRK